MEDFSALVSCLQGSGHYKLGKVLWSGKLRELEIRLPSFFASLLQQRSKETVKDGQIACPIEQQWLEIKQFTSVDAFDAHLIIHEAQQRFQSTWAFHS
jgi:hypothetical protein